jgi:hypothetical protein
MKNIRIDKNELQTKLNKVMLPILKEFHEKHPDYEIDIFYETEDYEPKRGKRTVIKQKVEIELTVI